MPTDTETQHMAALPITVIAGYLGSGKTTLLNHLLRNPGGLRLGVLVNDFGSVNIDASLIEADDGELVQLTGGCVCCQFGDDLSGAVLRLAGLPSPRRPDHLVLETSGVAIPGPLLAALRWIPGVVVDAAIVVIDALHIRRLAEDRYVGDVVRAQISDADLLVVSKSDLVDDLDSTVAWLRHQTEGPVAVGSNGAVDTDVLLGSAARRNQKHPTTALVESGDRFVSIVLDDVGEIDDPVAFAQRLAAAPGLWRAKGFFRDGDGQTHLLQIVGRHVTVTAWTRPIGATTLVCIGVVDVLNADRLAEAIRT